MTTPERDRLLELRTRLETQRKAARRVKQLMNECKWLETQRKQRADELDRADGDQRRIERCGLAALWHDLMGNRDEQIDERRRARAAAELRHEDARRELELKRKALLEARETSADIEQTEVQLEAAREFVLALAQSRGGPRADELVSLEVREEELVAQLHEIEEAYTVWVESSEALDAVLDTLQRTSNWGVFDVIAGGPIVTWVKHGGLDRARSEMEDARESLQDLERELRDVARFDDLDVDVDLSAGWRFADFFLDGFVVDAMVQSRISGMIQGVEALQRRVDGVGGQLRLRRKTADKQLEELRTERDELLLS